MTKSKFNAPQPRRQFSEGQKSKGILDDYATRGDVATKEGTIEHTPTAAKHIVNKKYVDDSLEPLTDDSMADTLHRHSELSASDGSPDAVFAIDAGGNVRFFDSGNDPTFNIGDSGSGGTFGFLRWVSATDTLNLGTTVGGTFNDQITLLESGNVGIGNVVPSTTLHVGAGTTRAADGTHNLVIDEGGGNTGLGIYSTDTGFLRFGDVATAAVGGFSYVHATNTLNMRTGGFDRVTIDGSGVVNFTGAITTDSTVDGIDIATDVAANTLKDTNVTTNITVAEAPTNVEIQSSDGSNDTIAAADVTNAGVMTTTMYDEHVVNTAKDTYVKTNIKGHVFHDSTAGTARATGFTSVEWVGSVEPTNAVNGDTWIDTT